eukprot:m.558231 g.558231  ORF g.558231 m.558231 type:complete len:881 (+) comp22197_c0_seq12:613-3255(+)
MSSPSPSSVDSVASGTTTVPLPVPPPAESALAKENRQRREGEARLARLCTGVTERLAGVEERVDEVCHWLCDVISPHLPPNGHARTVAACVGLTKALVEFRTLAVELVRLVRVFLEPWDRKESVLTNLLHHHDMIKGDNRTLLHQLQVATTRAEKLEQQRVLVQWERLYLRLHRKRRHGHRWQFLLPSLKQRELARRRGDPVPDDDSSGDDESPDEGDAPGVPPLPVKRPVALLRGRGPPPRTEEEDSEEVRLLRAEVEVLRARVATAAHRSCATQTPGPTLPSPGDVEPGAFGYDPPGPAPTAATGTDSDVLCVRVLEARGWDDVVPAELFCTAQVGSAAAIAALVAGEGQSAEATTSATGETATTTLAAVPDTHSSTAFFDPHDALTLVSTAHTPALASAATHESSLIPPGDSPSDNTHIAFALTNGLHGDIMAIASVAVDKLRACVRAPTTTALGDGLTTTTTTELHVPLRTTPACTAYRAAATPTPRATPPTINLVMGVAVGGAPPPAGQGGVASRRHHRLASAWQGLGAAPDADGGGATDPDGTDTPLGLAGFLFDPAERELEHATFSMQEVMVLAMLHAKQLQAMDTRHRHALAEALARPRTPATPPPAPPPVNTASAHVQTEAEPLPTRVVEERVVEKVVHVEKTVEKVVHKVVEKIVKVPVYLTGGSGKSDIPPIQNQPVRDPTYLAECPDEFFARLNWFAARKRLHHADLAAHTRATVEHTLLQQMASTCLESATSPSHPGADAAPTVSGPPPCLPAKFQPSRVGVQFSPAARAHFHAPGGAPAARLSQPPSMVSLPELDLPPLRPTTAPGCGALKTLNLSDRVVAAAPRPSRPAHTSHHPARPTTGTPPTPAPAATPPRLRTTALPRPRP